MCSFPQKSGHFFLKYGIKLFRTTEFFFFLLIYPDYTSICAPTSPPPPDYGRLLVDVLDRPVWRRQRGRPILLPTPGSGSTGAGQTEFIGSERLRPGHLAYPPRGGGGYANICRCCPFVCELLHIISCCFAHALCPLGVPPALLLRSGDGAESAPLCSPRLHNHNTRAPSFWRFDIILDSCEFSGGVPIFAVKTEYPISK